MYTLNDTKDFNDRPNNRYTFTYASNQDVDVLEDKVEVVQESNIPLEGGKIPSNYLPTNTVQTGTDGKISSEVLPTNVVTLGEDGLISSNQLPGFVDDVIEVETLPDSGETGKIYVVTSGENVNKQYRWSGSQFIELTSGNIVIGEVTGTAYDGGKGKNLESSLNNHVVDTNVHVTTSEKELWNNKLDSTALNDYALKTEIPDVSNFATTEQVSEVEAKIPTDYVTSEELEEEINIVEAQIPNDYASEDELAAVEAKIPDISNLPTKEELSNVENEIPDVSGFATKEEVSTVENKIPDVSNLATKTEVEEVASNIPTDFITQEELNNSISTLATAEALSTVEAKIPTDYITNSQLDEVEGKIPSVSSWALTDNEETIPAAKLPSFVDDIVEVNQLPEAGESGKIYLLIEGEQTTQYRWSGTQFVRIDHDGLVIGTVTGTALDGKIGTDHINNSDIHVTITDKETWNNKLGSEDLEPYALKTDLDSYTTKEEATEAHEDLELKITEIVGIPIRTGLNKKYTNEEIFNWFGVEDLAGLKSLIVNKRLALKYGIQLSGNPHYYNIPVQYAEFLDANTIHIIAIGLDTSNDTPSKYDITINLNEELITETSNIKVDIIPLDAEVDLSEYALKTEIPDVSDFVDTTTLTSTVAEINNSVDEKIETGTADFATREEVQTELAQTEEKIPSVEGLASEVYVDGKITEVEGKIPSLDGYAKTSDIPDVSNFVTEDTLISTIQAETAATEKKIEVAVSGLATTTEVQSGLAEVEEKIPDISDLAKQSDNLSYNMGDFESLDAASLKAADNQFYNNPERRILHFSVNNTDLGMILNVMGSIQEGYPYKSRQYLYYGNHIYTRYISRGSTGSVSYTQWIQSDNVTFAGKGVRSDLLFSLTSESTVDDVKEALTYPNGDGVLIEDDLDACLDKGMFLKDYETSKPVMVGLHRVGPYYTFTLVENNIVKEVGIASDYTVKSTPNNAEYLRSNWNKLPVESKIPVWSSINGVKSASTILGWFNCETVEELRDKIQNSSLVSMLYLNSGNMFYRIPIEFIELKNSDNQIHLVTVGVDMSDDSPTRYEITANLDGTIIDGTESNVKVEKKGLLSTSTFDNYKKQMFGDIDVDKYTGNNAYSAQFLPELEQSYIDDLGNPDNINGEPYNPTTNNYVIGQPYLTWAYFDESFTFHYDLYSKSHGGFFGDTLMAVLETSFTTNHMEGNKASAITSLETSADNNAIIEKINELISVLKKRGVTL